MMTGINFNDLNNKPEKHIPILLKVYIGKKKQICTYWIGHHDGEKYKLVPGCPYKFELDGWSYFKGSSVLPVLNKESMQYA